MTDERGQVLPDKHRRQLAIVTGAGSGLGRALSIQLNAKNIRVVGVARNLESLHETGSLCAGALPFVPIASDVSDPQAAGRVFARIEDMGVEDLILINNAAVYDHHDFVTDPLALFEQAIQTNFMGAVTYTHLALRHMVAQGRGRIINIGSFADVAPFPGSAGYSVSKGALRLFTRAVVADIGKRFPDIVVNDWVPGVLQTKMGLEHGLDPMVAAQWGTKLALLSDPALNGRVFDMDQEMLPPRSLKRRIAEALRIRPRQVPYRLGNPKQ